MNYFRVGKILNTHGLKGDLKIKVVSDFDRFYKGAKLYILNNDNYELVTVKDAKDYKDSLLVRFYDLEDINLVLKYKNKEIFISEEDRTDLDDGEYYFTDLIGKDIINQDGKNYGKCIDVEEVPQGYNLVFIVDGKKKRVPFIQGVFIKEVTSKSIIINEIEGLI